MHIPFNQQLVNQENNVNKLNQEGIIEQEGNSKLLNQGVK